MMKTLILLIWIILNIAESNQLNQTKYDFNDDTITIEASEYSTRNARHIEPRNWLDALGEGNPCLASTGAIGACISFRNCYPHIRQPSVTVFNSWLLGSYETCSYFAPNGRQLFGICCINQPPKLDDVNNNDQHVNNDIADDQKKFDTVVSHWPPPLPTHPPRVTRGTTPVLVWPPPIPTHPPNHQAPTHPPTNDHFGTTTTPPPPTTSTTQNPWWPPATTKNPWATTTTKNPWATTTTQNPWATTKKPIASWPPPLPTHPPSQQIPQNPPGESSSEEAEESAENTDDSANFQASCGAKNGARDQERIVGGQNASPNEWPWVVVLFNNGRQFCGGSLIDSVHILTAAHCVAQMSSWDVARLTAHLGDHDIRNQHEVRHMIRRIKRVVRHKGFEFSTLHNDVAVLTLDQPVTFSRSIHPVCLPTPTIGKSYRGQWATVAGWGSLRENGPQPAVLQKVTIQVWSNDDCARKYGGAAPAGIISTMLCAGTAAKDSCSGDSGGPLMLNEGGGRWTQVGIVSWGIGCGKGQYPGVYTRVSAFMPWITKNLK